MTVDSSEIMAVIDQALEEVAEEGLSFRGVMRDEYDWLIWVGLGEAEAQIRIPATAQRTPEEARAWIVSEIHAALKAWNHPR